MCVLTHTEVKLPGKITSYVTITLHPVAEGSSQHWPARTKTTRTGAVPAPLWRGLSQQGQESSRVMASWVSFLKLIFFFPLTAVHKFAFIVQIAQIYIFILSHTEHCKKGKKASLSWSIKDYLNHILFSLTYHFGYFSVTNKFSNFTNLKWRC